jgi:hypothetical protein
MSFSGFWTTYFFWLPEAVTPQLIAHTIGCGLWPYTPTFWLGPDTITISFAIITDGGPSGYTFDSTRQCFDIIVLKTDVANGLKIRESELRILDHVYWRYKAPVVPDKPLIFLNNRR